MDMNFISSSLVSYGGGGIGFRVILLPSQVNVYVSFDG